MTAGRLNISRMILTLAVIMPFVLIASWNSASADDRHLPPAISEPVLQNAAEIEPNSDVDRPQYLMKIRLDTARRHVSVNQVVKWTNPGSVATDRLVFQVTANHKLTDKMIAAGERTVESLRLQPENSIDYEGRRFHLNTATCNEQNVNWSFDREHDTHLILHLPKPVAPGESVEVELNFWIDIPTVMGRLGQHKDVTNLLNWYPVLAVFGNNNWQPVPYIAWHQPWYNEAADYTVTLQLPADHKTVTGGHVVSSATAADGYQTLNIVGEGLRDFTIVASRRFSELTSSVDGIPIRVLHLPEDRTHAETALKTAEESIRLYSQWFGPYPYKEFELAESYFGWNGNESSGVVMIDQRIFSTPKYTSRYVEHLVSHEICHQWWYSAVGTNGYAEPWMDEGHVTWFTRVKMEDKYGADAELLSVPGYGPFQLPNIQYRSLVHTGYEGYLGRGGNGAALGSLDEIGHLHNLLSLVYDRGARVVGMIQQRMGRDQFFAFMQHLFTKYEFKILLVEDYRTELEAFTGEDWGPFFQQWLEQGGTVDWDLKKVTVTESAHGYETRASISNTGNGSETVGLQVSFSNNSAPMVIANLSESHGNLPDNVRIQQTSPNDWLVTIVSDEKPSQLIVDPEGCVIDSAPSNNSWKTEYSARISPFYTPIDETGLMQPFHQKGAVAGFGLDKDGRLGLRAALISSNKYRISPFLAYTAATASRNDDHISAGVDAVIYNAPASNWQVLGRYEYALLSTLANDPGHQTRFALRRVINYTTSLIYPDLSYIDFYTRFGDNFFPDEDNTPSNDPRIEQYGNVRAFGVQYHADSQMPYWDPDKGVRVDANYEHGFKAFGGGATYDRVSGQLGAVQRLNEAPGWLSETKVAGRISGGYGWNDNGEHFRFGGPGRFRGRDATATEGNAFWLSSLEWRFPVAGDIDYQVLDNTAALQSVDGALFYDVGQSYLLNEAQGKVDHAIGAGLYFQIPLLSFVENVTIRTEYGYSLTNNTGAFWFGLYRAF